MPVPYGSTLHILPINLLLLAANESATQEPYKKNYLLMKNIEEFFGEKNQKNGPAAN